MMDRKYSEELARFDNSEVMVEFMKIAYDSGVIAGKGPGTDVPFKKDTGQDKEIREKYNVDTGAEKDGEALIEMAHKENLKSSKHTWMKAGR